ncbi:MAG: prepilin-type N-terminal cleavage/methylation domain-containing protein [Synergistaceae bacterium]|nr:prepilin-type N-terminal cleavage/methylation domain-containing protein [Synergistaceae bacterium]
MKKKSRKGFTLIELFLVVVVLVILAGAIVVAGDNSVVSAEADNIINNMRILKTAALEWLADHGDFVDRTGTLNYMVTYPYSNLNNEYFVKGKAEQNIQNVMRGKEHGRDTVMKYIKTATKISVNGDTSSGSSPTKGGYALVDASWGLKGGYNKWYVVYQFEGNSKHERKIKKKIADRAEELELYKHLTDFYTMDASFVYMPIIDLAESK